MEAYYIDNTADNYKLVSLADEGGTKEDAWFHYGVDDCNDLILGAIPKNDLYLVDTDRDEILIFGAQALRYLWDAHDGVNAFGSDGCSICRAASDLHTEAYAPLRNGQVGNQRTRIYECSKHLWPTVTRSR